jgi:hypothetical protein
VIPRISLRQALADPALGCGTDCPQCRRLGACIRFGVMNGFRIVLP